jgi:hypothetical protein
MHAFAFGLALLAGADMAGAATGPGSITAEKLARLESSLQAGEWSRLGAAEDSVVYVKRVSEPSERPRILVRFENLEPVWTGEISARSEVALYEVDCAAVTGRLLQSTGYTGHNLGGSSRLQVMPSPVVDRGAPGSPFEAALKTACTANGVVMASAPPRMAEAAPLAEPPRRGWRARISSVFRGIKDRLHIGKSDS